MLSLAQNPPIKPVSVSALGELRGDWFVAHTKARNEKAFAWELERRGVGYFLPMVERVTFSGGRARRNMAALFPGYVFFCGDAGTRSDALATGRLCQVIPVTEPERLVGELTQVDLILGGGGAIEYFPHAAVGRRVRVVAGPYEGSVGVVVDRQTDVAGGLQVVVNVTILGVGAAVRVPPDLLVAADEVEAAEGARESRGPRFEIVESPARLGSRLSRPGAEGSRR